MGSRKTYDIAVIGSGFGGALFSMAARRLGLSVLLLERGAHPRFAIGESTSPLTNLLIEELAKRFDLPRLLPLTTYGAWQREYPGIACGLKRGFTYFEQHRGQSYRHCPDLSTQLLVAASPNDDNADTHWFRADVDAFLVEEAIAAGADYHDHTEITELERVANGWHLTAQTKKESDALARDTAKARTSENSTFSVSAKLLIDASGPRGFLSRHFALQETTFSNYPRTQALFSHFTDVAACADTVDFDHRTFQRSDPALLSANRRNDDIPPYAMDDAAVHHVFDGGWMWLLRFNNGVTSAGFACTDDFAREIGLEREIGTGKQGTDGVGNANAAERIEAEIEAVWFRFLSRFPSIEKQFSDAKLVRPLIHAPRLAYRTAQAAGTGWAMLPSAAAFIDPLFSTGFPLTLLGIERLLTLLEAHRGCPDFDDHLRHYGETTLSEADSTAEFIGGCYRAMPSFPLFSALSMFYFTAASYSEMARRFDRVHLAPGFLAAGHKEFRAGLTHCLSLMPDGSKSVSEATIERFTAEVAKHCACLNIAGLCDPAKHNWYGVDLNDVIEGASRLAMTPDEVRRIIETADWAAGCSI